MPQPTLLAIGGAGRSGTTILGHVCHSHPDIALSHEVGQFNRLDRSFFHHIRWMRRPWRGIMFRARRETRLWTHRAASYAYYVQYLFWLLPSLGRKIDVETVRRAMHRISPRAKIVGDKTPGYFTRFDQFLGYPDFCCLLIYRDCRDVVASTLNAGWYQPRLHPGSLEHVTRRWVQSIEVMERLRDQIFVIRYEDMVHNPQPIFERLGRWLGVDPAGFDLTAIHPESIGKHKHTLTPDQLERVLHIAEPAMHRLGYL